MTDPLSLYVTISSIVQFSGDILSTLNKVANSHRDAPNSLQRVIAEVNDMNLILGQVQVFLKRDGNGTRQGYQSHNMSSDESLKATLTGCFLVYSRLDAHVCDLVDKNNLNPTRRFLFQSRMKRIRWALWQEAEVMVIIEDLQRHKLSLNLMLNIIQWYEISPRNVDELVKFRPSIYSTI